MSGQHAKRDQTEKLHPDWLTPLAEGSPAQQPLIASAAREQWVRPPVGGQAPIREAARCSEWLRTLFRPKEVAGQIANGQPLLLRSGVGHQSRSRLHESCLGRWLLDSVWVSG